MRDKTSQLPEIDAAVLTHVTGGLGPILGGILKSLLGGIGGGNAGGGDDGGGAAKQAAPKGGGGG